MKKEILFVLLNGFADWEAAHIAVCLNSGVKPGRPVKYIAKTLSLTKDPVISIGGFRVCRITTSILCPKIMPD